jgi:hypothetical protein
MQALAPPLDIKWSGHYEQYGTKNPVNFENMSLGADGAIKGNGTDGVGAFTIEGKLEGTNISFEKKYPAHAVVYKGTLKGDEITGTWEIPGNCNGTFQIDMECPKFVGHYTMGDGVDEHPVLINISEKNNTVYGLGNDPVGNFRVSGAVCPHTHTVRFTKSYFGAHEVHYTGLVKSVGGKRQYKGHWHIPNNCDGRFVLTEQ